MPGMARRGDEESDETVEKHGKSGKWNTAVGLKASFGN